MLSVVHLKSQLELAFVFSADLLGSLGGGSAGVIQTGRMNEPKKPLVLV